MSRVIILHTNDIHGRVEGLARIAALVAQVRAGHEGTPVFYFDLGDSEEYASRLSGLTKGVAMHQLLEAAGCDATVVGNAVLARHGAGAVAEEAAATAYPHLLANIHMAGRQPVPGTQATALLQTRGPALGLIGVTATDFASYERFFGLETTPPLAVIRELASQLRAAGADAIILLSHLGIDRDRELAAELGGDVALILGGHSHTLLPQGEWIGDVLLAQAGEYAAHLGRVVLQWDGESLHPQEASLIPVTDDVAPSVVVQARIGQIENDLQGYLDEVIVELPQPLDLAFDRECGMGNLLVDALRTRTGAQVALAVPGPTFTGGLPAGPLTRGTLWATGPGTGNPGVVTLNGAQLAVLVQRGLDRELAAEKHPALRGQGRGLMHVSGAVVREGKLLIDGRPPDPQQRYRVAASDFELEPVWGYADEAWELTPAYEVEVIMRDAAEDYLREGDVFPLQMGRLDLPNDQ